MFDLAEVMGRYSRLPSLPELGQTTTGRLVPTAPRVHSAQKRLGPDALVQLVAEYVAGTPSTELMRRYHLAKGTVLKILNDHGVQRRNQPLTPEQITEATQLYLAGWSMAKVGRHYGRAHTVIRDVLRRESVTCSKT